MNAADGQTAAVDDGTGGGVPRHVAIIMDGNGRWAQERGFGREYGHRAGAGSVRAVITEAGRLGVEVLTLYSFSSENWKRPAAEIGALMELCVRYCEGERAHLERENVRVRVIGRREGLPPEVIAALESVERATEECTGLTLCLAVNYGSRQEIADAARRIAEEAAAGALDPSAVDEGAVERRLYTSGLPDVDLLVRTAGERRLSNYLLWQVSYAEIVISDVPWPEFREAEFRDTLAEYARRVRRFGGLAAPPAR